MKTQVLTIRDLQQDIANIRYAAKVLQSGGLVAIPTETVYGIAANALDESAVKKIFAAKGRPQDNPLIVHIATLEEIPPLVRDFPPKAQLLAQQFWPGPLTMILPKSKLICKAVSAGLDTVAIRMPSHPVARALIHACELPLAAPSANLSGSPSPTTAQHCIDDLDGRVDLILNGGSCAVGVESTVLTLASAPPCILRPGVVTLAELRQVIGEDIEVDASVMHKLQDSAVPSSPGMKYKHYAPKAKLVLVHGDLSAFYRLLSEHPDAAALVFDGEQALLPQTRCVTYGAKDDPQEQAQRLFAALRELDQLGIKQAFARAPDSAGMGLAVYNRLLRAAGFEEEYLTK